VEAYLMRAALSGDPAVLSPNQAIDSAAIQSIADGNRRQGRNPFVRAVAKGLVRVTLPEHVRTLLDHCLNTLQKGKDDPDKAFIFSSLNFLYAEENGQPVYDAAARTAILNYIYNELNHANQRNRAPASVPVALPPREAELVDRYIRVILELDRAIDAYDKYAYRKELYPIMVRNALVKRLQNAKPQTALSELIVQLLPACDTPDSCQYRSYYYRLCDRYTHDYGAAAVREVRELLDLCYNQLIAFSLKEPSELNIAPELPEIAALQAAGEDVSHTLSTTAQQLEQAPQQLDWEAMVDIFEEVTALCEEKGLTWQEALAKYHARQSGLPFMLGGKFALVSALTIAISNVPIVGPAVFEVAMNFLSDAAVEFLEKQFRQPSVTEVFRQAKQARKRKKMMDYVVCTQPSSAP